MIANTTPAGPYLAYSDVTAWAVLSRKQIVSASQQTGPVQQRAGRHHGSQPGSAEHLPMRLPPAPVRQVAQFTERPAALPRSWLGLGGRLRLGCAERRPRGGRADPRGDGVAVVS
jgi:hypothetical protein